MDQDSAPGLTPGHLGAPPLEPPPQPPPAPPRPSDRRRRQTGLACGLTALLLAVAAGGAVLLGRQLFSGGGASEAADYTGGGTGSVQVSVPRGASLTRIGQLLVKDEVVSGTKVFIDAAATSGEHIQPGTYVLKRRMSAAAALVVLGNPANANGLTIPEGWRATQIYAAIDQRLSLAPGTAQHTAEQHQGELGLPDYAGGDPEGLLFPSTYSVTSDSTPLSLLQQMAKQAGSEFSTDNLDGGAVGGGLTAYQTLALASLVQGEADNPEDMGKVARVIYNRLAKNLPLQLDSTINYALGRATLHTTVTDTRLDSPFNTYQHAGLPPTPIDSPGHDALNAALNPAAGDWLYFVTVKPGDTRFTDSEEQHRKNVEEFNSYQAQHQSSPSPAKH